MIKLKLSLVLGLSCFCLNAQPIPPDSDNTPAPLPGLVWLAIGGGVIAYRKYKTSTSSEIE